MVNTQSANMNVPDYCAAMERGEIIVNRSYQRSDKVWPDSAKSYLIESLLLGYPIPKLYLHVIPDTKNRRSIKEIVDGQQRSNTILDFYNGKFKLSRTLDTEELRGLNYSSLPEDWQGRFISYNLSIDQFVGSNSAEVRQVFRRMNSYTVPLNPEELRHADHQGTFKWFLSRVATNYTESLVTIGVFSPKAVVRMQDLKLYAEIASALDVGVTTTNGKKLDALYDKYDVNFPAADEFRESFDYAFGVISSMIYLRDTNLAKHYHIYSLALALMAVRTEYIAEHPNQDPPIDGNRLEAELLNLSSAIDLVDNDAAKSPYADFIQASADQTNVKDRRERRISAFKAAIEIARG